MTLVFIYYENPRMLRRQIECWNSYADLPSPPRIILVDDASPKFPAKDVLKNNPVRVPFELHRIEQDIPWNFSGARNLGCRYADGWIHVSDMDTLIYAEDLKLLTQLATDEKCFYLTRRMLIPTGALMNATVVNLTFHKSLFERVGGYDEDYCGHYGREHTDFFERMKRAAKLIILQDVFIWMMPKWMLADACTTTIKDRSDDRNTDLFLTKRDAGFPRPATPLRFTHRKEI